MNVLDMISNQQHIYDVLKQNKINDRLSHAYLFYGDEGVGKKEMAYALACLFYCEHDGCFSCDTCQSILNDQHLNVTYIGVLESKKLISKEQITALQEEFSKTSLLEGPRIYIVDGIDTASASAQNSLLKFIEEPINNTPTIGIFIATDLANVVSTIVSRCSLIHFPSIEVKKLVKQLEKEGIDSLDAALCSLTTNNIAEAKAFFQTKTYTDTKTFFLDFLAIKNKKQAVLLYINQASKFNSDTMKLFFKWLIAFYEDIFKIEDKEDLILTSLYDKILLYAKMENVVVYTQFQLILDLYSKLNYNVSAKNIFHELISKLF
ncbi:MAG: hypothetical protein NC310_05095 [Roseburia sp.]|nr:hypothetical protein [Anaeroplasma bactoclasticum]MCM1196435.1 hypothetical protein [Roseburia sp.]MCM1557586.1 hypothetical protein [Anaeroplasma bactoclasticum]